MTHLRLCTFFFLEGFLDTDSRALDALAITHLTFSLFFSLIFRAAFANRRLLIWKTATSSYSPSMLLTVACGVKVSVKK